MGKNKIANWTDDFSEFRAKVESAFGGKLEVFAEQAPDFYAHMVLSHGFMEYFGVRGIHDNIKKRILSETGSCVPDNSDHQELYLKYEKEEYLKWARDHNLPEHLLELGWETYRDD